MQSTGQTSRHASHPVQLSALITATSLGSFFRDPLFAMRSTLVGYRSASALKFYIPPVGRTIRGAPARFEFSLMRMLLVTDLRDEFVVRDPNRAPFDDRHAVEQLNSARFSKRASRPR